MNTRISAYLSVYNDWDILPFALQSLKPYVAELIVVDGAYEWMIPYLTTLGIDPAKSDYRVYAAIEASGIPFRVISRPWKNEIEKRIAGYEACANRYVFRLDADEVMFIDEPVLNAALSANAAVGEMRMPNYVAPGWISRAAELPDIECQSFFFDREQVSAEIHLNYLWLVLTADKLPHAGKRPFSVYAEPLAFNAHLTNWRTPDTSVSRAVFYTLNWMRKNGVPWVPELVGRPLDDVQSLFNIVSPNVLFSSLRMGQLGIGLTEDAGRRRFVPSPLTATQEATFFACYENFVGSLVSMNQMIVDDGVSFLTCLAHFIDISTPAARKMIAPNGRVTLRVSLPLRSAKVQLITYTSSAPGNYATPIPFEVNGPELTFVLPTHDGIKTALRQAIEFQVWTAAGRLDQRFKAVV